MIDWVSIVRHSRRRFSNYAPNLRRLRPPKNPSSHKTDKEHRNKFHHNNHHQNNCGSAASSPTDSETTKTSALSCCYCHVMYILFEFFFIEKNINFKEFGLRNKRKTKKLECVFKMTRNFMIIITKFF